ncbi:ImmA/IrrE family metallo-endopeptidase [Planktotalea sp.]|uniref:ImmA/IrrE family metallo-endopeptidase n=1 Tax=Planktotalea sp. TaxID=2029877 RepID=UPI0025FE26DE|nr:ImmA/IrrE family metallo-endopeptidase [Planktotalea sp.]
MSLNEKGTNCNLHGSSIYHRQIFDTRRDTKGNEQTETFVTVQYEAPMAIGASKTAVDKFAENVATRLKFNPSDSIEGLIERSGGKLVVGSSGHGDIDSGSIIARAVDDYVIYISCYTSLKRERFTIAHELGHLLLHFGKIKNANPEAVMRATRNVDPNDKKQQKAEWKANWFAAGFLMPRQAFSNAYENKGLSYAARLCGVSDSAAEIRVKTLKLKSRL